MQPFESAPLFCFAHFWKVNEVGGSRNHSENQKAPSLEVCVRAMALELSRLPHKLGIGCIIAALPLAFIGD
jgi:hypothetical protein